MRGVPGRCQRRRLVKRGMKEMEAAEMDWPAVSYTHLTLPTIRLV